MEVMEEEEMMLEAIHELFSKGRRDHDKIVARTDDTFLMYVFEQTGSNLN